jgi:succinyl-CoA synthetase beta subunit
MARIHEHQGKSILAEHGIKVPRYGVASTADQARQIATDLGGPVVVKIQAWTTGRKKIGGVAMVNTPEEAKAEAERMLGMTVGAFPVTEVLVEEQISIDRELFVSLSIDDAARGPTMLLSAEGGSGIEDRAGAVTRLAVDAKFGPDAVALESALTNAGFEVRQRQGRRGPVC